MNLSVKIKDNDQLLDANIELADGVMIVSPVVKGEEEPKFDPKDGDIVAALQGRELFICKRQEAPHICFCYVGYNFGAKIIFGQGSYNALRYATEEEKKRLFDVLEKNGYRWNAEERKLEKIKWEPKYEEEYCYPSLTYKNGFIVMKTNFSGSGFDVSIFNRGWMFNDKEECQQLCNKLNQAINSVNQ